LFNTQRIDHLFKDPHEENVRKGSGLKEKGVVASFNPEIATKIGIDFPVKRLKICKFCIFKDFIANGKKLQNIYCRTHRTCGRCYFKKASK